MRGTLTCSMILDTQARSVLSTKPDASALLLRRCCFANASISRGRGYAERETVAEF